MFDVVAQIMISSLNKKEKSNNKSEKKDNNKQLHAAVTLNYEKN